MVARVQRRSTLILFLPLILHLLLVEELLQEPVLLRPLHLLAVVLLGLCLLLGSTVRRSIGWVEPATGRWRALARLRLIPKV